MDLHESRSGWCGLFALLEAWCRGWCIEFLGCCDNSAAVQALLRLLGVANAKQRKTFCRDVKGKFAALAMNSVDYVARCSGRFSVIDATKVADVHQVMIRLATTVDDTVMLSKTMLAEWIKELGPSQLQCSKQVSVTR